MIKSTLLIVWFHVNDYENIFAIWITSYPKDKGAVVIAEVVIFLRRTDQNTISFILQRGKTMIYNNMAKLPQLELSPSFKAI